MTGWPPSYRSLGLWLAFVALVAIGVLHLGSRDEPRFPAFPASDYDAGGAPPATRPLVGAHHTHFSFAGCTWNGHGILASLHESDSLPGLVHRQLEEMRAQGISTIRIIVWHMTDAPRQPWGVVPSRGGRLAEPYRSNLIHHLGEIRDFGFARLNVSFSPQWTNSPRSPIYDPRKLDENWAFLRDVRGLVERFGPADSRYDLFNEGAPSDHADPRIVRQMSRYVAEIYGRYVDLYGHRAVVVSSIVPRTARDRGRRLSNLLDILASTGRPLPRAVEIHLNVSGPEARFALAATDSILDARGLEVPIVVGETSYDDPDVARAIASFRRAHRRPVLEIVQWFKRPDESCETSPPYVAAAYRAIVAGG